MNRNKKVLESFIEYCEQHPQERFWQALRNWIGVEKICVCSTDEDNTDFYKNVDTFYWEEKDK